MPKHKPPSKPTGPLSRFMGQDGKKLLAVKKARAERRARTAKERLAAEKRRGQERRDRAQHWEQAEEDRYLEMEELHNRLERKRPRGKHLKTPRPSLVAAVPKRPKREERKGLKRKHEKAGEVAMVEVNNRQLQKQPFRTKKRVLPKNAKPQKRIQAPTKEDEFRFSSRKKRTPYVAVRSATEADKRETRAAHLKKKRGRTAGIAVEIIQKASRLINGTKKLESPRTKDAEKERKRNMLRYLMEQHALDKSWRPLIKQMVAEGMITLTESMDLRQDLIHAIAPINKGVADALREGRSVYHGQRRLPLKARLQGLATHPPPKVRVKMGSMGKKERLALAEEKAHREREKIAAERLAKNKKNREIYQ